MNDSLPLIRSVKACIVGSLLVALPYLFFLTPGQEIMGPLPAVYAVMMTLYLLPTALCMVTMICGLAATGVGLGVALFTCSKLMGAQGLTLTMAYVLPILGVFFGVIALKTPFWKGLGAMVAAHVAALTAVFVMAQRMAGGDLYNVAGNAVADYLKNWELGDTMLYQFYAMGLLDLRSDLADSALEQVMDYYRLSDAARADLLLSVRTLITGFMQSFIPSTLSRQSVLGGVACMLLPLRFGFLAQEKREFSRNEPGELNGEGTRKVNFPDLGMPSFSQWHIPTGFGWQAGVALAAGYLMQYSATAPIQVAGILLYGAASAIFTVQGAAAINFLQKRKGSRRFWRVLVPVLLMLFQILIIVGIFDQISNFRRLRKPPEPKEDILL